MKKLTDFINLQRDRYERRMNRELESYHQDPKGYEDLITHRAMLISAGLVLFLLVIPSLLLVWMGSSPL